MPHLRALLCVVGAAGRAAAQECAGLSMLQTRQTSKSVVQAGESSETGSCKDYPGQYNAFENGGAVFGSTDNDGDGCGFYATASGQCGSHDDDDFFAGEMCCSCGGGSSYQGPRSLAVNKASVVLSEGSDCPSGFEPITSTAACRAALDMVGLPGEAYKGQETDGGWPKGCYYCENTDDCTDGVWFNKHGTGQAVAGSQRLCHKGYDHASAEVLFVGDSDIDYWDSAVAFPGSLNVGVGGYTTSDVKSEVDTWVAELGPKWVVIVCGENDIDGSRSVTIAALARFKEIVGKFIADGARVIYLGTKPEPGTSKGEIKEYKYYDAELRKYAASQSAGSSTPFIMIDVFKSFTSKAELYNSDQLHMSRLGYKFWNGWVKLAMASAAPCVLWQDGVCVKSR